VVYLAKTQWSLAMMVIGGFGGTPWDTFSLRLEMLLIDEVEQMRAQGCHQENKINL